jgi:hypothetical protein
MADAMFDHVKLRFACWTAALALAIPAIPFAPAQAASAPASSELSKFFADYFEERLRDEPEFATSVGRHEYDDRRADVSKHGRICSSGLIKCRSFHWTGFRTRTG